MWQGSPLSSILFHLFIEYLAEKLRFDEAIIHFEEPRVWKKVAPDADIFLLFTKCLEDSLFITEYAENAVYKSEEIVDSLGALISTRIKQRVYWTLKRLAKLAEGNELSYAVRKITAAVILQRPEVNQTIVFGVDIEDTGSRQETGSPTLEVQQAPPAVHNKMR
ncbi:hypothetical protein NDU88_006950 [Pleurodeles waltl]|uniref:Uncharacterized protein n=1 Tax=Pleurodeles waltl TaxID=8319 RepID=A0AAV7RRL1_PLEWA|nr:hypothetical protein NDU88_006950 [Pleurodeles waltl]